MASFGLLALVGCTKTTRESDNVPVATEPLPGASAELPEGDDRPEDPQDLPGDPTLPNDPATPSGPRVVMVSPDHPLHDRLEGEQRAGECSADTDCHVGGCGGEVCSAVAGVSSTCEVLPIEWPKDRACGCVDGRCLWWGSERLTAPPAPKKAHDGVAPKGEGRVETGVSCGSVRCKPGEECITYYGIAGPNGPAFQECGIRCDPGDPKSCPTGKRCITIADGPGSVCR